MKTMKKLQVAVAVASMFAAGGSAMAAAISQSGVTIAREVISRAANSTQKLIALFVSFNYSNGPTANALSAQDFSLTLELGGDGTPTWDATSLVAANIWRTVNAVKQTTSAPIVVVGPASAAPAGPIAYIRLLDVTRPDAKTVRYFFRFENPLATAVSLSDLAMSFNSVNPTTPPVSNADYAKVTTLQNSVSAIIGSTIGSSGTAADACGNSDTRITVQARNFIGSGASAPEGETAGQTILNNGYILFAQALNVQIGKGIAPNRATDPTTNSTKLTPDTNLFGTLTSMPLGFIKFSNVPALSAWDTSIAGNYYGYARNTGVAPRDGDLGTFTVLQDDGDIDVNSLVVTITSTNGFAAGAGFSLTNNPFGTTGAAGAPGTDSGSAATSIGYSPDGLTATVTFNHGALVAAANSGIPNQGLDGSTGLATTAFYPAVSTDRFYLNYIVPGNAQIPLSSFSGVAKLTKETGADEQDNLSCPGTLAGLGGGVKIDVRNFFPYNPANPGNEWIGVIRVINNDENVAADLTGQYIRADGKYGKWGSLGTLPARGARYFLSSEIDAALTSNSTFTPSLVDNSGPGGITTTAGQALPANTRLRISSNAASTLRVQSYIYNATTRALVEVSASQGADFVNVEAAPRDHIDQDAQTGIKK